MTTINLSGDGIVENLFHFLWTKDQMFNSGPYVLLPDTIIYRFQTPAFWYFTSKEGKILRKNKANVNNETIKKSFLNKVSPSGIVAVYYFNVLDN